MTIPEADSMAMPLAIIDDLYPKGSMSAEILLAHSIQVRDKALAVARRVTRLRPDTTFIAEAAMLHDIGIYQTAAAGIGCHGTQAYIRHGIIGRNVLENYGLHQHALVCERHIGVGITRSDIESQGLPLPPRDMLPVSIEEQIISYADAFFSKTNGGCEHSLAEVLASLAGFGRDKVNQFMQWHRRFGG
jgi:uncharacterized protein